MLRTYNNMIVSLIPALIDITDYEFKVLPVGIHEANLEEIEDLFAFNTRRRELYDGLLRAFHDLRSAGCRRFYVDGSFVTSKPIPGDFDACYELTGIDRSLLNPVFFDFRNGRMAQKRAYGGEFFPSNAQADAWGRSFLDFFQNVRGTSARKGILTVSLTRSVSVIYEATA